MSNGQHPPTTGPTLKIERLVAFSDAVLAISITLLVLGLEVPSRHKIPEKELPEFLLDSLPSMLAYVTSFLLVGMYWLQHFVIFHYITRATRILVILNGLFLLSVSFLPFPTGVHALYRSDPPAAVFFGCAHIVCGLTLLAMWLYATHGHRLIAPDIPRSVIRSMTMRISMAPAMAVVAIAASFFAILAGKLLFLLIPVCYFSHRLVDAAWQERPVDKTG